MTTRYTENELKIITAALPVVEAVPASQDSCWPGDGPAHDDDCTVSDHAASIAAVAATEGLSWEFYTWSAAAKHWRALTREASETRANPELRMKVYAYVTADHLSLIHISGFASAARVSERGPHPLRGIPAGERCASGA